MGEGGFPTGIPFPSILFFPFLFHSFLFLSVPFASFTFFSFLFFSLALVFCMHRQDGFLLYLFAFLYFLFMGEGRVVGGRSPWVLCRYLLIRFFFVFFFFCSSFLPGLIGYADGFCLC